MMKTTGNKIKLGVFVTLCLAIFIAGIYLIGKRQLLFSKTFRVSAVFNDIGGLQIGNKIRFSGINVGLVENIQQVTDSSVRVDMQVDESTKAFIKKSARALIGSDGLMGSKIILLTPGKGNNGRIANNDTLTSIKPASFDDILVNLKVTTAHAAVITEDLAAITANIKSGNGTVGMLLMDNTFAKNLNAAMFNIREGAGGFKQNMDAASHNFLLKNFFKKKKAAKDKADKKE
jgi:phospholipid/cholesterol/gamma-HCH transport system substrate-binding protein